MRFSIVIPTLNRPEALRRCLTALARLDYPKDQHEVIVVDDGGSAELGEIVAAHPGPVQLTLVRQPHNGPSVARNAGAARAAGRFLAFTDDDCEPSKQWLHALDAALAISPGALVGGPVTNGLPGNLNATASQVISDFCHAHFNRQLEHARFFPSNNIAMDAELYQQIGGFDPAFQLYAAEDRDFCDRWLALGRKLAWAPDAVVSHHHRTTFVAFRKQHFHYGRSGYWYAVMRRRRNGGTVLFEGWRFHVGIVLAPLRSASWPRSAYLSFLVLVSQAAVALGYAWETVRRTLRSQGTGSPLAARSAKTPGR